MTHQGFILLGEVTHCEASTAGASSGELMTIELQTPTRTWFLSPDGAEFQLWLSLFRDRISTKDAITRQSAALEAAALGYERLSTLSRSSEEWGPDATLPATPLRARASTRLGLGSRLGR
uniref:PH domain-containing protein n=2 Tax=Phaeomonas parva TaxID=124430 RepID=A0A7S1XRD1_9STRA|mmetsp:Transcript_30173/g.96261  ORF Transcript_30173/g.96261 Transcript_30173/m.96261 type:complete len:120 (+) Transcript_30173:36-395(+)